MLSAAESFDPRGKHQLPARPLLWRWSAARWLCSHLPFEETGWGALLPTVNAPAHWECFCSQPTPWPPSHLWTSPTLYSKKGKSTQLGLGSEDTWPGLGNKNPESQSYDATKLLISLLQSWSWNNTNTEISDQIMLKRHAKCVITNIFVVWSTSVSAEESETQSHKMR